jgi:hypothetical protein
MRFDIITRGNIIQVNARIKIDGGASLASKAPVFTTSCRVVYSVILNISKGKVCKIGRVPSFDFLLKRHPLSSFKIRI